MSELLRAEWQKAYRNTYLFALTVGIFPLGIMILFALYALTLALDPSAAGGNVLTWPVLMEVAFTVPSMFIGQILLMAFAASIFAGESSWNTWKSIIPRTQRLKLILIKYLFFTLVIFSAFNLMGLIVILGSVLLGELAGTGHAPVMLSAEAFAYGDDYLMYLLTTMLNLMMAAGYAAIASIFTRSILGGTIAAVVISIGENASLALFLFLQSLFDTPFFLQIYKLLPGYNILNIQSWVMSDSGVRPGNALPPNDLGLSFLLVAGWLILLLTLSVASFYRRDIT